MSEQSRQSSEEKLELSDVTIRELNKTDPTEESLRKLREVLLASKDPAKMRAAIMKLADRKDRIEKELIALQKRNVRGPLVDSDGFPRKDIDVFEVRTIRHSIAKLEYSQKLYMTYVQELMQLWFKMGASEGKDSSGGSDGQTTKPALSDQTSSISTPASTPMTSTSTTSTPETGTEDPTPTEAKVPLTTPTEDTSGSDLQQGQSEGKDTGAVPFVVVEYVLDNSPAAAGGLRNGDLVVRFGDVTANNFSLRAVGSTTSQHLNKPMPVHVVRSGKVCKLTVTPGPWSGQGVLGCMVHGLDR